MSNDELARNLTVYTDLASFGQAANVLAGQDILSKYRQKLSAQTRVNQRSNLKVFERFLHMNGVSSTITEKV